MSVEGKWNGQQKFSISTLPKIGALSTITSCFSPHDNTQSIVFEKSTLTVGAQAGFS